MKTFLQYFCEDQLPPPPEEMEASWNKRYKRADPYDWDTGYGTRFKFVHTPPEAQNPPQGKPTISLVTPANGDAWAWPEVDAEQLAGLKQNWPEIQKGIASYKRAQIETGRNVSADDVRGRGSAGPAGMTPTLPY